MEQRSHIYGVLAEFATPEQLLEAVKKVREAGYRHIDAFTPFPVEGLYEAMGLKRNNVPLITLLGGLAGGIGGFGLAIRQSVARISAAGASPDCGPGTAGREKRIWRRSTQAA